MKVKLDENLSRHLKTALVRRGHDASTAGDEGLLGKPDRDVAAAARAEDRMILTLDLEFGDLRKFPPGEHPGVVLFRPVSLGPGAANRLVQQFIAETDLGELTGCVVVVEPHRVRIRRPQTGGES